MVLKVQGDNEGGLPSISDPRLILSTDNTSKKILDFLPECLYVKESILL